MNRTEFSCRSVILAILLSSALAMSNAYLALKLGILTSASIPAAIISMGILRLFKHSSVLENNAVQTAASAGEAVAGGIVYTIPALLIIGYWQHFDYWTNCFIAASGGILGVLFSIPLRRLLVHDPRLRFPEGVAIAELLKSSSLAVGFHEILWGGVLGAMLGFLQNGVKILSASVSYWLPKGRLLCGIGMGFSPAMLGSGFIIGFEMSCSIFMGAILAWLVALPIVSHFFPQYYTLQPNKALAAELLWNSKMRYFGIGAMLFAGVMTFLTLLKPLCKNMQHSWQCVWRQPARHTMAAHDKDLPGLFILIAVVCLAVCLLWLFADLFPIQAMGLGAYRHWVMNSALAYVLIVGFLFAVMTAYFSGMVGVTASPGSSVVIAGILIASWCLYQLMCSVLPRPFASDTLQMAEATVIIISAVITGIAAIANDNIQDLKVGQLVGATPWKQQLMLLLGVSISALIIPWVMQLLFEVYGIAGIMPHAGMDISQTLPAPTAALLAAITESVFHSRLPWEMMVMGATVMIMVMLVNHLLLRWRKMPLSMLGIAMGMYLPMTTSCALFLGGLMAYWMKRTALRLFPGHKPQQQQFLQVGTLLACGLVAGAALIDVVLAIPFSMLHSPDALRITGPGWQIYANFLSIAVVLALALWIRKRSERIACNQSI